MSKLLESRTAVILGLANKWSIAYAIGEAFHREGARIILTYQGERQKETVEQLGAGLGATRFIECDVSKDADIASLADQLKDEAPISTVVHSIAFANREDLEGSFLNTSRPGFLMAHDISAYSLVAVSKALSPLMTEGGSIMTLSYLGAVRVMPNYNVMGIAKASLEACVRYLAYELGASNIRVNGISAGPIKTTSARGVRDLTKMMEAAAEVSPLKRKTDPAEVADTAVFLASPLGRGVTGNIIYVDAGYQIMGKIGSL